MAGNEQQHGLFDDFNAIEDCARKANFPASAGQRRNRPPFEGGKGTCPQVCLI
jgi:hypothetical protein